MSNIENQIDVVLTRYRREIQTIKQKKRDLEDVEAVCFENYLIEVDRLVQSSEASRRMSAKFEEYLEKWQEVQEQNQNCRVLTDTWKVSSGTEELNQRENSNPKQQKKALQELSKEQNEENKLM